MLEEEEVVDDVSDEHSSDPEKIVDNTVEVGKKVTVHANHKLKEEVIVKVQEMRKEMQQEMKEVVL